MGLPKLPFTYFEGDTLPDVTGTLPFDLDGYSLTLTLKRPDGSLITKTAEIDAYDEDEGTTSFRFAWSDGDLQAGLNQVAQVFLFDEAGARQSAPQVLLNVGTPEADE